MKICSKELRKKRSEAAKKRWSNPEFKARVSKKIGVTSKIMWSDPEFKKKMSKRLKGLQAGEKNPMYGRKHSDETREKLRESHQGPRPWMIGYKHSEESRKKMSESHNEYQTGEGHPMFGKKHSEESRQKMSKSHKDIPLSKKHRENIGKASELAWASVSEEKRNEWVKNIKQGMQYVPNKPEIKILSILDSIYPREWKFVGDGQVVIAGKCPDFINVNGQKKIIELFGDYWHRGHDPQDRINIFKPFGYETLVIWEHELKNMDSITKKIHDFMVM